MAFSVFSLGSGEQDIWTSPIRNGDCCAAIESYPLKPSAIRGEPGRQPRAGPTSRWRRGRNRLFDPALNISLGQKYLNFLLARDDINGNIIYAVAGYNAGPGAVSKWHTNVDHRNDPLLFLESIPYRETRGYVVRVLANLWAYRERLSQQPASLDQVAAGAWPIYKPQDGRNTARR